MAAKRLLVLTSATGGGHDAHARATAEWCARLYGGEVEVTIAHALEDSHRFYAYGVAFYNFIQRRAPWFHHIYYNFVELLELLNPGTVSLGRDYYVDLLRRVQPHAVLGVMDCLNRGYFELAKETLGPAVKCATYCTEFEGGYGFSRNWVNPRGDYFLARTEEARAEAIRRGVPAERALVAEHWERPDFYAPAITAEEKTEFLSGLGLAADRFTLLLSTGGAGAQNHRALLASLFPLGDRLQVIALCGRDEAARARLQPWADQASPFPVRALGFRDDMPVLLQASSAVVARAGATTAGEALLCGCPIVFNALGGIMPQEMPTWRYFHARRIGHLIYSANGLRPIISRWLDQPVELEEMRVRVAPMRETPTPAKALTLLLESSR